MDWALICKLCGIGVIVVGSVLYVIWYLQSKDLSSNGRLFISIACLLIGCVLVSLPAILAIEGCSNCGRKVENDYVYCPGCGKNLSADSVCSGCGEEVGSDDIFCSKCGSPAGAKNEAGKEK